ncbi:UNVERIFIED_CONTAM: Pre-cleavage factor Im subunit [Sesamum calycinum]|uniref:Pre-mRNA cleavage factor Im 25 kDa subunit n=1 Tax=Sesamum calycinum TaxID=2727403 RepID=A0AAW2QVH0_9LAMI
MVTSQVVNTYPLSSYTFGTKEPKMEKDTSVADRLARMKVNYMKEGMRTSVDGILLKNVFTKFCIRRGINLQVQEHNHPHILLLQIGNTFCKLPGGRLKPGEWEAMVFDMFLVSCLPSSQIKFCIGNAYRKMHNFMQIERVKMQECKKLFLVHLSDHEYFAVPKNLKLLAVPLFELYDNVQVRQGSVVGIVAT